MLIRRSLNKGSSRGQQVVGFSDYIVYVDESGDHGLKTIDPNYPIFVLAFCIFRKHDYMESLVPALQAFKFRHFGHDQVILHETDIRKDRKAFTFLKERGCKEAFLGELLEIVAGTPFMLVCSVIRKEPFRKRYTHPDNPYHVALGFGLERVFLYLRNLGANKGLTHIVVEQRGKREDKELELEFRRICTYAVAPIIARSFSLSSWCSLTSRATPQGYSLLIWWLGLLACTFCGPSKATMPSACSSRSSTVMGMAGRMAGG